MITRRTPFPGPNRGAPQGTVGYCRSSVQFQFKKAKAVANLAHEISLGEDFMRDVISTAALPIRSRSRALKLRGISYIHADGLYGGRA